MLKIIHEDENVLVVDKPARIIVFPAATEGEPRQRREKPIEEKTIIDLLLEEFPYIKNVGESPRYGIVHRLDKETSGILLVAKNNKSLKFLQREFSASTRSYGGSAETLGEGGKGRRVFKEYLALVVGDLKPNQGKIETLIGRDPKNPKKQKAFSLNDPEAKKKGLRKAITEYKAIQKFSTKGKKGYTLVTANPQTGRKHQIRCHFSYLGYPVVGDKVYGFKNQPVPENLQRHFLHASYLKIRLPNGKEKEFQSTLPEDLKLVLENLNHNDQNPIPNQTLNLND